MTAQETTRTHEIIRCNNLIGEKELQIRLLKTKKRDLTEQIKGLESEVSVFKIRQARLVNEEKAEN